jgi:hypothetical protein
VVHNAGSGVARAPYYIVISGTRWSHGYLAGAGLLMPGAEVRITTALPTMDTPMGVLVCRDLEENTYAWNLAGKRRTVRKGSDWEPGEWMNQHELLATFYPEIDSAGLELVGARRMQPDERT